MKYRRAYQAKKKWSKRIYIYIYTVRHNFPRITAGKKWRQRLSNLWRKGGEEERDSFPGRRIAKPNSSPPPSASPSSSLVFPVCAARARSFSPPLSLGNWIVASNSARREPRGGSEFLCFFPLCLRPSPFVENFPLSLRILSLLLSSSIHLYSSSILVES